MFVPRHIEREILLALYRYRMLTSEQLSLLLHYELPTLYNAFRTLKQKRWVEPLSLDFLPRNVKGWILTKEGMEVAFGLTKEYRIQLLRRSNSPIGQTEHLYGSNRFFTDLIRHSLHGPDEEGLIDWIGMRDGGDRYSIVDRKGKKTTPLRPDGIGTYRFANGNDVIFHVEYDTGSEHLWVLHNKLWQYVDILKQFWSNLSLVNVLFITRDPRRSERILGLWKVMREDAFRRQSVPAVWTVTEGTLAKQGPFASVWIGSEYTAASFQDFPRLDGRHADRSVPLGKQMHIQPFAKGVKGADQL
ncbi:replication-relaxation family protein [Ferroacidibacillus organovorans]|uniref:Replication-relaxation n=1 Tax=Ferroacidibacillus organovorans TaxID=1765683 RepID=A0A117SXQ4_9BACL|nr:replication-relaxation family protein [Ferroacidibacillus organovorans]KUO95808.1 hypothetical protein ATW55_15040 [Ferroacidibacillus organovorans]